MRNVEWDELGSIKSMNTGKKVNTFKSHQDGKMQGKRARGQSMSRRKDTLRTDLKGRADEARGPKGNKILQESPPHMGRR